MIYGWTDYFRGTRVKVDKAREMKELVENVLRRRGHNLENSVIETDEAYVEQETSPHVTITYFLIGFNPGDHAETSDERLPDLSSNERAITLFNSSFLGLAYDIDETHNRTFNFVEQDRGLVDGYGVMGRHSLTSPTHQRLSSSVKTMYKKSKIGLALTIAEIANPTFYMDGEETRNYLGKISQAVKADSPEISSLAGAANILSKGMVSRPFISRQPANSGKLLS